MASYRQLLEQNLPISQLKKLAKDFDKYGVYPNSVQAAAGAVFFLARDNGKHLIVHGPKATRDRFEGQEDTEVEQTKICPLNLANYHCLREYFPYLIPTSHKAHNITFGLGDRLGFATAGHLRLMKDYPIFPVIAQQSMRELNLCKRTYEGVLMDAAWAVFQEGYTKGFGADGDHLKTADEIRYALDCGYTMITLDCSEVINNDAYGLSEEERKAAYEALPPAYRAAMEKKYLGRKIVLKNGEEVPYTLPLFYLTVLVYHKVIDFAADIYFNVIKQYPHHVDFEVSVDETLYQTDPIAHYIVASELLERGVDIASLAPRFVGEFQKGVDYIGNVMDFEADFALHEKIADHFGYKISVHSGSDKFAIFPVVGEKTNGFFHIKTAGTNWLEFVRMVAMEDPALFRQLYRFAQAHFEEAKQYYHVSARPENFPDIDTYADEELPSLFDPEQTDSRQLMHITYGYILNARNADGSYTFRDALYTLGYEKEATYYALLKKHIGRHVSALGIKPLA